MVTSGRKGCGQVMKAHWNALSTVLSMVWPWSPYQDYLSLIRPHLESVWSPELIRDISKLEHVQKFALWVCTKQWFLLYKDLTEKCQLTTRRNHLSFGLLLNTPLLPYSPHALECAPKFIFPSRNLIMEFSFHRAISLWNSLPSSVTTTTSLLLFRRQLLSNHN